MPPSEAEYHCQMAEACRRAGKVADAVAHATRAVAINPMMGTAHANLGAALRDAGRLDLAIESFKRAVEVEPQLAQAWNGLGNALVEKGRPEAAIAAYRTAIEKMPGLIDAHSNLGVALMQVGNIEAAIESQRRAVQIKEDMPLAQNNLGSSLLIAGDLDGAERALNRAVELNPDLAEAHFTRSLIWLARGDFARGWREYEWRLRARSLFMHGAARFSQPRWDGGPLEGKRVLIHAEAGFGDTLQFVRYVPMVAERGGRVMLGCQKELAGLLRDVRGVESVVTPGERLPPFDVQCPLLSLPCVFSTTLETLPGRETYLRAIAECDERWRGRMKGRFKVGVAWAGDPRNRLDRWRSIAAEEFSPILSAPNVTFYRLPMGRAHDARLIDWTSELTDFGETAGLVANLDLVITVDTAVAHLAGAMGKRVWVLIPKASDFRWLLAREDSPWYPSMRLFRQKRLGDWQEVVVRVKDALMRFHG
jgi:Flp pilus assembly protein TadD